MWYNRFSSILSWIAVQISKAATSRNRFAHLQCYDLDKLLSSTTFCCSDTLLNSFINPKTIIAFFKTAFEALLFLFKKPQKMNSHLKLWWSSCIQWGLKLAKSVGMHHCKDDVQMMMDKHGMWQKNKKEAAFPQQERHLIFMYCDYFYCNPSVAHSHRQSSWHSSRRIWEPFKSGRMAVRIP